MLPYLANLTAFHSENPVRLEELARRLAQQAPDLAVMRPRPQWVVQVRPLPRGPDLTAELARHGLFFVEGPEYFQTTDGTFVTAPLLNELRNDTPRLAKFETDLGFLHIPSEGAVTLVRSCAGRVPLYYWELGDVLAISSTLHQRIHCFPEQSASLDPLVCAMHVSGLLIFPEGRTTLQGVQILETGHLLKVQRPARRPRLYWPTAKERLLPATEDAWRASAEQLKKTVLQNMERELSSTKTNLFSFSGGVDSSCAVSIAGHLGKPTATYSLLSPYIEHRVDQERHIRDLHARHGVTQHLTEHLSDPLRAELAMVGPPLPQLQLHPVLGALPRLVSMWDPVTLTGGEYADRLLGGRAQTIWDLARDSTLPELRRCTTRRDFIHLSAARALWLVTPMGRFRGSPFPSGLRPWLRDNLKAEYRDWREDGIARGRTDSFPRWHLRRRIRMNAAIAMNWEACSRLGIRRTYPFLSRTLLDMALTSHPSDHFGRLPAGIRSGPKRLLRRALEGIVPHESLYQRDKPRLRHPVPPGAPLVPETFSGPWTEAGSLDGVISPDTFAAIRAGQFTTFAALQVLGLLNIVRSLRT